MEYLSHSSTGFSNTGVGSNALQVNQESFNTAVGKDSMLLNTSGTRITAVGAFTMDAHTTGNDNTALGYGALSASTTPAGILLLLGL